MEEEILFKIEIPTSDAIDQLEKLKKSILGLKDDQKALAKAYKDGTITSDEYAKGLVRIENNLKVLNKEYSETQKKVTGVKGAFDDLKESNNNLRESIQNLDFKGVLNGIAGMTKASLAFIATPIGIVIVALGAAIAALTAYFRGSEEGQTKFNKIMNVGAAIVGKFSDLIQFLGGVLFENLSKGFEKIIGFLNRFVPGFEEATNALSKYLNLDVSAHISALQEEQVQLNRLLITERGRLRAAIEDAKLRAESTKDAKVRSAALQEVTTLTNELFDKESRLAKLEQEIAQENAKLANNTIEDNDAIAEAIAKVDDIERQRAAALKENATKQLAITEQQRIAAEKERDNIVALKDAALEKEVADSEIFAANEERHQRELEQINERIQAYVSESEALQNRINLLDLESDLSDEATDANKEYEKEIKRISAAKAEEARVHQFAGQAVAQSLAIAQQVAGQSKSISTGIALISTYFAAQKAFESQFLPIPSPSSPIRGAIAAALAVAGGLARVAQINKIAFADGGLVEGFAGGGLSGTRIMGHHGRSIRRSNGDNLLATVKTGEVILNERQQARLGGAATFRAIGVPGFASGGSTALSVATAARNSESIGFQREIFNAISQIRPVVTVEDINTGQTRVDVIDSFRQVQ